MFKEKFDEWYDKVLRTYDVYKEQQCEIDRYSIICELDIMLAEAFDREPLIAEEE